MQLCFITTNKLIYVGKQLYYVRLATIYEDLVSLSQSISRWNSIVIRLLPVFLLPKLL